MTVSSDPERLQRAVAYALTGEDRKLTEVVDPATLVDRLGGVAALRAVAAETRAAGKAWPYPIPDRLRAGLGAAQLQAAVEHTRALIDQRRGTTRRAGPPDGDDLRLIREVPPHHGH